MEPTPLIPNGAVDPKATEEIIKKYDSEARFRQLSGWQARVVSVWLILMSLFHLYASVLVF